MRILGLEINFRRKKEEKSGSVFVRPSIPATDKVTVESSKSKSTPISKTVNICPLKLVNPNTKSGDFCTSVILNLGTISRIANMLTPIRLLASRKVIYCDL